MRQVDESCLRAPCLVLEMELADGEEAAPAYVDVKRFNTIWCLARLRGYPMLISFWDVAADRRVSLAQIRSALSADLMERDGMDDAGGKAPTTADMTVVVCTRDRPTGLRRTLLSLQRQSTSDFNLLVVDNAPSSAAAAQTLHGLNIERCEYVVEPRRGLSRARNRALDMTDTALVAWIDDDEVADADWVVRLKAGFAHESNPAAVCGVMLPAELESEAQVRFEQYGGFNKGRGLSAEVLLAGTSAVHSPLYPLPAIGSGGNMAFRLDALRAVGGFDPCLGAGTRTHGGEETRALASILQSHRAVLHWPSAITWHYHRREMAALRDQFYGYSAGLSAFYASMIRSDPSVMLTLLRLVPHALRDIGTGRKNLRSGQLPSDFPRELLRAGRRGLVAGWFLYAYEALNDGSGSPAK